MTITAEVKEATKQKLLRDLPHVLGTGREQATTGAQLAHRFGLRNDRSIRIAIRELISSGLPVASGTSFPAGFFLANSQDEADEYAQALRDRLIEDAKRRRDFLRAAKAIKRPGQLPLM